MPKLIAIVAGCLLFAAGPWDALAADPARPAIRFDGLGTHGRTISTRLPEAQAYFDQGLAFLYAFNHDEAIRSFQRAAMLDPESAMPQWGIALANGPHINFPLVDEPHAKAAWAALSQAQALADKATPMERELIDALAKRYADPQPEDRRPLDEAYANAMRELWAKHPVDADIGALFAESLMDLQPWNQWTRDGQMQPGTQEVLHTLEAVLARASHHPLALHLYIHAVEASPHPQMAADAADRLRDLQPGLGHLVHMPSHIDVRLGRWQQAIVTNEKAIRADAAYRRAVPDVNFYRNYMAHNHHMLAFAAMMQGQNRRSTRAIREMLDEIPAEWLKANAAFVDCQFAMPYELHLRFGRWDEMLAEPEPSELFPIARAVRWYARGVALAAKGQTMPAREEQARFLGAKQSIAEEALFVLNKASDVLGVAEQTLDGEILYREGKVDEALDALREAVRREENLRYIEPPDWIQPVRHVLGATLMEAQRFAEAEAVYRRDLEIYPENGWSLFGLARCLRAQQKLDEAVAVDARFKTAWRRADVTLTSSCYCLPGKQ